MSVYYTDSKHHIEIDRISFTFYNDEDRVFNERYRLPDYEAQSDYRMSLAPDKSLGDEELGKFLRACAYHGNMLFRYHGDYFFLTVITELSVRKSSRTKTF